MNRIIVCALGILSAAALVSCGAKTDSSSSVSSPETVTSAPAAHEETPPAENRLGEHLARVAELIGKGKYTLECTLTSTQFEGEIKIKRIVDGSSKYQLQTEKLGSHGSVAVGGKSYDFDYVCGMYRETSEFPELDVISRIRDQGLAPSLRSSDRIAGEDLDTEQYVYTGETFITTMDFYFDKDDGRLVRYTTRYSVEGRDDILETRIITRLDDSVDSTVFNAYFADELVDFDSMSEEERQGFCRGVCARWGITSEALFEMGVSAADLKTIDYDTLFRLVYSYGKLSGGSDDSSSEPETVTEAPEPDIPPEESSDDSSGAEDGSSEPGEDSSQQ
ncbi:MAG: hypothetical protein IKP95_02140 [Ruminococcus sp.]|nr:hypothetical protein [Ruminococcus sp.]